MPPQRAVFGMALGGALVVCACGAQDLLSLGSLSADAGAPGASDDEAADAASADVPGDPGVDATSPDEGGSSGLSCVGLECRVDYQCPNGGHTTLSGTVFDPAGQNPLYSVIVFVPIDPGQLPAIAPGTRSCNTCDVSIGQYVAATTTDAKGAFTLVDVPYGTHIPLVVQTGKWRRLTYLDTVARCQANAVPAEKSRLPRNKTEGDMPQMALVTGGCDDLGCFLRDVGIDASEFSSPHAGGRLDVYQGQSLLGNGPGLSGGTAGDCTGSTCPLWDSKQSLEYYDMVLLACECTEQPRPTSALVAMHDWLGEGGKVFATHFHYTWFKDGPSDFQGVASWLGQSVAAASGTYQLDTSFYKGQVFHDWLANVGALSGNGIALTSVGTSVAGVNPPTTRWIYDGTTTPPNTKYLSFLTPIRATPTDGGAGATAGAAPYCGKAVFTDLHTSGSPSGDVPAACSAGPLTAQQKALEFLLFDL